MFNLERSIISAMQNANMKHCFIICNSEYVMKNRNRVQCTVRRNNDSSYLEFFVEHGLSTTLGGKRDVITDGMESLRMKANSNLVFGMNLPLEYNENGITVKPVPALNRPEHFISGLPALPEGNPQVQEPGPVPGGCAHPVCPVPGQ